MTDKEYLNISSGKVKASEATQQKNCPPPCAPFALLFKQLSFNGGLVTSLRAAVLTSVN